MSTVDLETLRAKALEAGTAGGWAAFGSAVGIDGETLRQFAKASSGRKAHPETLNALRRYFSEATPSELHAKAQHALTLIQEGQQLLQEVVRLLPSDGLPALTPRPNDPEAQVHPPDATQSRQPPARRVARPRS